LSRVGEPIHKDGPTLLRADHEAWAVRKIGFRWEKKNRSRQKQQSGIGSSEVDGTHHPSFPPWKGRRKFAGEIGFCRRRSAFRPALWGKGPGACLRGEVGFRLRTHEPPRSKGAHQMVLELSEIQKADASYTSLFSSREEVFDFHRAKSLGARGHRKGSQTRKHFQEEKPPGPRIGNGATSESAHQSVFRRLGWRRIRRAFPLQDQGFRDRSRLGGTGSPGPKQNQRKIVTRPSGPGLFGGEIRWAGCLSRRIS